MYYFTAHEHYWHNNIIKYCSRPFKNAKEMNEEVMWNHINLYVNEFSLALGNEGRRAVKQLIMASAALNQKDLPEGLRLFLQVD